MLENEFEKRMRQEMGEFRLRPSDLVWEKVEEELKKKKKRRVIVFFFLLAGLCLLGYTGYFLIANHSKPNLVQQDISSLKDNKETVSSPNAESLPVITNSSHNEEAPAAKDEVLTDKGLNKETPLVLSKATVQQEKKDEVLKTINKKETIIARNKIADKSNKNISLINPGKESVARQGKKSRPAAIQDENRPVKTQTVQSDNLPDYLTTKPDATLTDIVKNNPGDAKKATDQTADEVKLKDSSITEDAKAEEAVATIKKSRPGSKITWGIDLSTGVSFSRNNAFSLFSADKSMDALYSSPITGPGSGVFGPVRISPSEVKAGRAFRAGIVGEMQISKKSSISSGLQYVYHSNKIDVGYYTDTTVVVNNSFSQAARVDAVYRGSHQKEYINRYHFIQIPVQYHLQLTKGSKMRLSWDVGASAGYLFATNGLVYDTTASGIYYHDDAAFNKFQWNLNTGVSFRFGNKNKVQWSIGPEVSMSMNKLMKDDYTKKQYLLYGGLTGRLFFKKRNSK